MYMKEKGLKKKHAGALGILVGVILFVLIGSTYVLKKPVSEEMAERLIRQEFTTLIGHAENDSNVLRCAVYEGLEVDDIKVERSTGNTYVTCRISNYDLQEALAIFEITGVDPNNQKEVDTWLGVIDKKSYEVDFYLVVKDDITYVNFTEEQLNVVTGELLYFDEEKEVSSKDLRGQIMDLKTDIRYDRLIPGEGIDSKYYDYEAYKKVLQEALTGVLVKEEYGEYLHWLSSYETSNLYFDRAVDQLLVEYGIPKEPDMNEVYCDADDLDIRITAGKVILTCCKEIENELLIDLLTTEEKEMLLKTEKLEEYIKDMLKEKV